MPVGLVMGYYLGRITARRYCAATTQCSGYRGPLVSSLGSFPNARLHTLQ